MSKIDRIIKMREQEKKRELEKRINKREQIIEMRKQGKKCREVAEALGVSCQYVSQVSSKVSPGHYVPVGDECVYPNLRNWMNERKLPRNAFLHRMGMTEHPTNYDRLRGVMTGKLQPRKSYIDKMIEVTGLPYETLFAEE